MSFGPYSLLRQSSNIPICSLHRALNMNQNPSPSGIIIFFHVPSFSIIDSVFTRGGGGYLCGNMRNLTIWWSGGEESVRKFSDNTLFWVRNNNGTLDSITYGEIGERIKNARAGPTYTP